MCIRDSCTTSPSSTQTCFSRNPLSGRAPCSSPRRVSAPPVSSTASPCPPARTPPRTRPPERKDPMATVIVNGQKKAHVREGLACVITGSIELASRGDADIVKITEEVAEAVKQTGLMDGTCLLYTSDAAD